MFPVTLGWTSVGGLTDNRQWEDMGKRHSKLSAWWPSVGGMQAGSDKGQTANCLLQFLLNAKQEQQKTVLAGFSYFLLLSVCLFSRYQSLVLSSHSVFLSSLSPFSVADWAEIAVTSLCRFSMKMRECTWLFNVDLFLGVCVWESAQWILTIWSNFICIVYCSPGTWSLVSFSHNTVNLSLVTSTWTYTLWPLDT